MIKKYNGLTKEQLTGIILELTLENRNLRKKLKTIKEISMIGKNQWNKHGN